MIDSTNPRVMADNIKELASQASVVKGNPTGSGFNTLLTKLQIGSSKYKLPANVVANPEGEATGSLTKLQVGSSVFSVAGDASLSYSTTEHEIGTWIDGSTVYEKTVSLGALPNVTDASVNHNISDLGTVIQIFGFANSSTTNLPLPYVNADDIRNTIQVEVRPATVWINVKSDFSAFTGYVTLRYTKSTTS